MQQENIIHIDWVDLDNIIITSSKDTYHKRFLEQIKDKSKKARIIQWTRFLDKDFISDIDMRTQYNKILIIENKFFYYIDYQKKSDDYFIRLVVEINSDGFLNVYKRFNREMILNEILKDDK